MNLPTREQLDILGDAVIALDADSVKIEHCYQQIVVVRVYKGIDICTTLIWEGRDKPVRIE